MSPYRQHADVCRMIAAHERPDLDAMAHTSHQIEKANTANSSSPKTHPQDPAIRATKLKALGRMPGSARLWRRSGGEKATLCGVDSTSDPVP